MCCQATGRLLFNMVGAIAQFETELRVLIIASATLPFCSLIAAGFHPLCSIDIGDAPYHEGRALFSQEPWGHWQRSYCQSDILTAISGGQPSWILRPRHLPSPVPLSSEPVEIQGPILKCHLGPQSGAVFAQRGSDKGPRPLSKAKASQSWGNGVYADSASRAVLRVSCLRC
jgi:hypothetical protein